MRKCTRINAYEKTMPNASILVDPDTTASNLKSTRVSSGRKDRSVPATDVPDVSESNIGDADLSFLLITELPQDEERGRKPAITMRRSK
ncbi:hypothetical protein NC652_007758 [Populus alba x Populus x berolinensis]|nr:hypothetical protein NC652_007758 [Populus alba x Populus x berolinensis]